MADNSLLKEPKSFLGAKPLLFDRLINNDINEIYEASDALYLSVEKVKESIQTELTRLLNTRAKVNKNQESEEENILNPVEYGLADLNRLDPSNPSHWIDIEKDIKDAITTFEPRLTNVRVQIQEFMPINQTLLALIDASLNVHKIKGEVTFPISIECIKDK